MFHGAEVFNTDQRLFENRGGDGGQDTLKSLFRKFIHEFDREGIRTYQSQVMAHLNESKHYINVSLIDMKAFD
jgi:hypothetical protein